MADELEAKLRPYHVWALGVGIVLVGEYMGWNFGIAKGGILGALLAMIVAGCLYIIIALCASELGAATKMAGGPYDWVRLFVGPGAAAIVGLASYMEYMCLEASDAIVVGAVLEEIFNAYNLGLVVNDMFAKVVAVLVVAILTFINYRGAVAALTLNFIMTAIAAIAIVVFFIFGVTGTGVTLNPMDVFTGSTQSWGLIGIFAALQFGPWFYLGIEGAAMCAEECKRPTRAVPLGQQAGMITLLLMAGLTLFLCANLVDLETLGSTDYPLFDAALVTKGTTVGSIIIFLLAVGTLLTCISSANGCVNDSSRAWMALGRDGFITEWFAETHPKYKTPYRAILFTMPVAIGLAFLGELNISVSLSICSGLVCYILIPFALIRFRKLYPNSRIDGTPNEIKIRPYKSPLQPVIALIAIALTMITMSTFYFGYLHYLILSLAFYIAAYIYFSWRYNKIKAGKETFSWNARLGWPDPEGGN